MVIWLTGLSGSGKTSISMHLLPLLRMKYGAVIHIDGDIIREIFGNDLAYDVGSRIKQVKRIQTLAKFISSENIGVLVSALYSSPELLAWNRRNFSGYVEVFVKAPLEVLIQRDTKGLYSKVFGKYQENVVGVDIEWVPPINPSLVIDTTIGLPEDAAIRIVEKIDQIGLPILKF